MDAGAFRSRALRSLWRDGDASKIAPALSDRLWRRLDALSAASSPDNLDAPGFRLHRLRGQPGRYSVDVNGVHRLTFEWAGSSARAVDLEEYS